MKKPHYAEEGIKHIRKLYRLEEELRSGKLNHSQAALRGAINHSLSQWDKMTVYLESPYLPPINYWIALFQKAPLAFSNDDWEKLLPWNIFTS